jgi:hypothetical protein
VLAAIGLALLALLVLAIVLLALILLIAALFSLFSDHGSDATPHPSNEEASGTGPQGGSSEAPAGDPHEDATGGGVGGVGGGTPAEPGTPNLGSPTGRDTVAFDLRVVDLINHPRPTTGFPPRDRCEYPAWWAYTGGWGVRVRQRLSAGWANGMRRIDENGRSWGYYHAKRVVEELDRD